MIPGQFVGVDWGSSFVRAALIAADGTIIERRESAAGASTLKPDQFETHFNELSGAWRSQGYPALLCGMVGARFGWREAPYVQCPSGQAELALNLVRIAGDGPDVLIVPGCIHRSGQMVEVMRGEETQILGAEVADGSVCLPGTHTKWAEVCGGRLTAFSTALTGEMFALLRHHSSVGQLMTDEGERLQAFHDGVAASEDASRLLHLVFQCRARVLGDTLAATDASEFLSGLLIGCDCRGARVQGAVTIIGSSAVARRYALALQQLGIANSIGNSDAAFIGLHQIFRERRQ